VRPALSQREIYDERYRDGAYDRRSTVRVLRAEAESLLAAARRAVDTAADPSCLSLLDFGYGTGRVTNEFLVDFPRHFGDRARELRVIAYDVSASGLARAADDLHRRHGFEQVRPPRWDAAAERGYVAGELARTTGATTVTVVFVHGNEHEPAPAMARLVQEANRGRPCLVTTSWYSGLGHIPGATSRDDGTRPAELLPRLRPRPRRARAPRLRPGTALVDRGDPPAGRRVRQRRAGTCQLRAGRRAEPQEAR